MDAARRRLREQARYYEEGRITIDRYIDAALQVREAETAAATTKEERIAAAKAYLDRATDVAKREETKVEVGQGTSADVTEAQYARDLAELDLLRANKGETTTETKTLEKRVAELERKLDRVLKHLTQKGVDFPDE